MIARGVSENQRAEVRLTEYSRQITSGGGKPGQGEGRGRCINAIPHVAGTLTNFKRGLRGNANEADFLTVAFSENQRAEVRLQGGDGQRARALVEKPGMKGQDYIAFEPGNLRRRCGSEPNGVRRLTPTECERLQGFPDGWTAVEKPNGKPMSDSARYRMLGNAVGVPVVEWIGRRIMDEEKKCKT